MPDTSYPDITIVPFRSGGSKGHRDFVALSVKARSVAATAALIEAMAFLRRADEAGFSSDFRIDFARQLYNELSDVIGENQRDLDNDNLDPTLYPIDRHELFDMIEKLEGRS